MEFYRVTGWGSGSITAGFNSQRDGILQLGYPFYDKPNGFQFPTGWNSTIDVVKFALGGKVSIPNGMEFYGADE